MVWTKRVIAMSDAPLTLGPHIISLKNMSEYAAWVNTHSHEVLDPGETCVFSILDTRDTIILVGDGRKAVWEIQELRADPKPTYRLIKESDLRDLLIAANQFWALESGGVDNWMWCGESCHDFLAACNEEMGTDFEDFESLADHELTGYPVYKN